MVRNFLAAFRSPCKAASLSFLVWIFCLTFGEADPAAESLAVLGTRLGRAIFLPFGTEDTPAMLLAACSNWYFNLDAKLGATLSTMAISDEETISSYNFDAFDSSSPNQANSDSAFFCNS